MFSAFNPSKCTHGAVGSRLCGARGAVVDFLSEPGWVSSHKFSDAVMAIFSGQSVISRVYMSCFSNGTDRLEPRPRWY